MIQRVPGILLVYFEYPNRDATTITDHIRAFTHHSSHPVYLFNALYGFSEFLLRCEYQFIVFHYTAVAEGNRKNYGMSDSLINYFKNSNSYKIAFFQDEYHYCQKRFRFINELKVQTVYSCYVEPYIQRIYGQYTSAKYLFTYIPGHISQEMMDASKSFAKPVEQRKIDIGYRGRSLPFYMGAGAREKYRIGVDFPKYCIDKKLNIDIAVDENKRVYGNDWYKFLGNCKACLGTESGVGITDLDNRIFAEVNQFMKNYPNSSFDEVYEKILFKYEDNIPLRTISPRHFEACVFQIVQILFVGDYSGILKPDIHYIPLKKDYSNIDEVFSKLSDPKYCETIRKNCIRDIVNDPSNYYNSLISQLDEHLMELNNDQSGHFSSDIQKQLDHSILQKSVSYVRYKNFPGKSVLKKIKDLILK